MSFGSVEDRIKQLEMKVRQLEISVQPEASELPWWERVAARFKDDPVYTEAMKLGAEIRKAGLRDASDE